MGMLSRGIYVYASLVAAAVSGHDLVPGGMSVAEVDPGGFILSQGVTHASEWESKAVPNLLERPPLTAVSLAGDTRVQRMENRGLSPVPGSQSGSLRSVAGSGYRKNCASWSALARIMPM